MTYYNTLKEVNKELPLELINMIDEYADPLFEREFYKRLVKAVKNKKLREIELIPEFIQEIDNEILISLQHILNYLDFEYDFFEPGMDQIQREVNHNLFRVVIALHNIVVTYYGGDPMPYDDFFIGVVMQGAIIRHVFIKIQKLIIEYRDVIRNLKSEVIYG